MPASTQQDHVEVVEHLVGAERGEFLAAQRGHAAVHAGRELLQGGVAELPREALDRRWPRKSPPSGVRFTAYQGRNTEIASSTAPRADTSRP